MVVAEKDEFVYLSDGRLKSPEKPKKKRKKHIQPVNARVEAPLRARLEAGETVRPEEIKFAIKCLQAKATK